MEKPAIGLRMIVIDSARDAQRRRLHSVCLMVGRAEMGGKSRRRPANGD